MWKVSGSAKKYKTYEEAWDADPDSVPPATETTTKEQKEWSPLERLRGWSSICPECNAEPCECKELWKSVDEISSKTD